MANFGDIPLQRRAQLSLSDGALSRALASGRLRALAPGVYVEGSALDPLGRRDLHLLRARAEVVRLGPEWLLARRSAAVAWGLPLLGFAPTGIQLTRTPASRRARSASRHRHLNWVHPDEWDEVDGLPVTCVARTALDIARHETDRSALVVVDAALRAGVTRARLGEVLARQTRWPGVVRARRAVELGDGRAETPLESLCRLACIEHGLPAFEPQVEVWRDGAFVARVDGLYRDALLAVESDGALKFDGPGVLPALLEREQDLKECGLEVFRVGWASVTRRSTSTAARLTSRLWQRAGADLPIGVELRPTVAPAVPLDRSDHYRWPDAGPVYGTRRGTTGPGPSARRVA